MRKIREVRWKQILVYFLAGMFIILFYFFAKNIQVVGLFLKTVNRILLPFFVGFVMAYLLCPVYNRVTGWTYRGLSKHWKKKRSALTVGRVLGTVASMLVLAAFLSFFIWLLVPQLVKTVVAVVEILPGRLNDLEVWLTKAFTQTKHPEFIRPMQNFLDNAGTKVLGLLESVLLPGEGSLATRIASSVVTVGRIGLDFLIGIIACGYFLNGKERFLAGIKRFTNAHFKEETVQEIYEFGRFTNETFGGFITGKILDSIVIGFLCYATMWVLGLPYAALISTIVGTTNIIPFFGPFIGAIPSAVIICVHDPIQALIFLIMVLALQQFDGNILGPFILGGRVGVASFWVMFSIIVGGGLFGVLGMLFAVPVFAIISYYLDRHTGFLLVKKGEPSNVEDYMSYRCYGIRPKDEEEFLPKKKKPRKGWTEQSFIKDAPVIGKIAQALESPEEWECQEEAAENAAKNATENAAKVDETTETNSKAGKSGAENSTNDEA